MRAVVQRVLEAHVDVEKNTVGKIGKGILVLLGVGHNDTEKDIEWLADKILNLRIFEDENDKMNLSLLDIKGEILVVSQFTLYGDCRKGRRPSYSNAAKPEKGNEYYEKFVNYIKEKYNINVETGVFQADMKVHLINDGPVTLLLDSEKTF
ncbi:D-aminoacyl-tRNA deacylase [Marinitoga lauensis]|uniref:D-aminoacyl-tRNA deacylase n=1 Tax=Marinitoga lauensis TaxID=2201189 RepID=UPI001011CC0F|nr:D-aminoacyl-tRNA deacylase [Marinitoga lauensis]